MATYYKTVSISAIITSDGIEIVVLLIPDE